ncbi:hypothetical protein DL764_005902 [Monosporascus ibericus]|uniref:Uncharacterized protein n=1 Tax=Monosporascus ibericus TaxID=155417 RepID=A0A4Q4T6W4_9PEZI|nr:hypothetical protein DL764_005902 [Monosporascus ibericus]
MNKITRPPGLLNSPSLPITLTLALRALGLQLLTGSLRPHLSELPKIAIRKRRRSAFPSLLLHLLPLAGCLFLIALNVRPVAVLPQYPWEALQFVAKVHEMTMQASVAAAALAYVRRELAKGRSVPFGALCGVLQVQQLSYLWSLEFWGAATARWLQGRRRVLFILFVPFCVLVAASVGPSSAMLMLPRTIDYPWFRAEFVWDATRAELFPHHVTGDRVPSCRDLEVQGSTSSYRCPFRDWETVESAVAWFSLYDEGRISYTNTDGFNVGRTLAIGRVWDYAHNGWSAAIASVQHRDTTDEILAAVQKWAPAKVSGEMVLPMVRAFCNAGLARSGDEFRKTPILFPTPVGGDGVVGIFTEGKAFEAARSAGPRPHVLWFDAPAAQRETASIYSLFVNPRSLVANATDAIEVAACAVEAIWTSQKFVANSYPLRRTANLTAPALNGPLNMTGDWPGLPVRIDKEWAQALIPNPGNTGSMTGSFLGDLMMSVPLGGCGFRPHGPPNAVNPCPVFHHFVAGLFASGLSAGDEPAVQSGIISPNLYAHEDSSFTAAAVHRPNLYRIPVSMSRDELGYSLTSTPVKVAVVALSLYSALAVGFVAHTLVTGVSSSAWDSIAELVALALNSERPVEVENATAGIEAIRTMAEGVAMREGEGGRLELVFVGSDGGEWNREGNEEGMVGEDDGSDYGAQGENQNGEENGDLEGIEENAAGEKEDRKLGIEYNQVY